MPTVAVQIVTYNSAKTIAQTLIAAQAQTVELETLFVIDNASTDDTVSIVQNAGITLIQNAENNGYTGAHNQGFAMHKTDYVLTLNPDILLEPDFIERMLEVLEQDYRLGSASGCLLRTDSLDTIADRIDACGLYMTRSRRQKLIYESKLIDDVPDAPFYIMGPDGAAAFYRRKMLDDIMFDGEVFDTDFFTHKEDVDVCWRAQLLGWKSICVPSARATHVRHFRPGQRSQIASNIRCIALRNRYYLILKNDFSHHFWQDILQIFFYEISILLYVLLRERSTLRAYQEVFSNYRKMIRKRQQIQARCRSTSDEIRRWFKAVP